MTREEKPVAVLRREPRRRRPMLLALVYGVFLVLVGVTASALVAVVTLHLSSATLNAAVSDDGSRVQSFVNGKKVQLQAGDIDSDGPSATRIAALQDELEGLTERDGIVRIQVLAPDGRILLSAPSSLRGARLTGAPGFAVALTGSPSVALLDPGDRPDGDPAGLPAGGLVQEYLPIISDNGEVLAAVGVWRDAAPLLARLDAARRDIVIVTLAASTVLAAVLFIVFRAAQRRLTRQQAQLIDAERRDALTEMLNHGAVVAALAERLEAARSIGGRIGVALLDVDNFRLFNDNHGHEAGDEVLLRVADLVEAHASDGAVVGRYGPDEFLIFLPDTEAGQMERVLERLRDAVNELSVQFGGSERLPITVSSGVAVYPEHADSLTDLLSAAAIALSEAKASGGDSIRVARGVEEERPSAGSFDVLQGLVIAVDTKDRYTKRHSEDVARYAVFLAERVGLDEELRRTLHLAGLLHDVGKIGIPDTILRKPAKLTAQEYDIFKQHVKLGDSIVRDVPQVDLVRAGIRHHHERWDGNGYLDGLEGEEIPLIGRILAVADAFSAMTTTRPYRKALPVEEALKRLGDAAGSQLQEELVVAFISGLETADDPPLPGSDAGRIWYPELRAA
jgi:diguanylate cyclase (GGDEF)-like protein/putative nucleotidyltransferase with HDIG domain